MTGNWIIPDTASTMAYIRSLPHRRSITPRCVWLVQTCSPELDQISGLRRLFLNGRIKSIPNFGKKSILYLSGIMERSDDVPDPLEARIERAARALCRARYNAPSESYPAGWVDSKVNENWQFFTSDAKIVIDAMK